MTDLPVLIVGLGNPGPQYAGTRHNIGREVLTELAEQARPMPASFSAHKRTNTEITELAPGRLLSRRVILARPRTYMNASGAAVKSLAQYFAIPHRNVFVIHDDMELPFGKFALRQGGGDKGHNGLRSITKSLQTKDYQRLSIGIGRPPGRMDPAAFVLKPFAKKELEELPILCADAADHLLDSMK